MNWDKRRGSTRFNGRSAANRLYNGANRKLKGAKHDVADDAAPDETLARLQREAERLNLPLETVIETAIEQYFEEDESTTAEILESLRLGMEDALAGHTSPAADVLAELRQELSDNADEG